MLNNVVTLILWLTFLTIYVVVAAFLVRQYLRTRNTGFVWLGVAVVIWPFVSNLLGAGQRLLYDRILNRQAVFSPFSLVEHGQTTFGTLTLYLAMLNNLIGAGLLLVAVLFLCNTKSNPQTA